MKALLLGSVVEKERDEMLKGNKTGDRFTGLEKPRLFSSFGEGAQRRGHPEAVRGAMGIRME